MLIFKDTKLSVADVLAIEDIYADNDELSRAANIAIDAHRSVNQKYDHHNYDYHLRMTYLIGVGFFYLIGEEASIINVLKGLWAHDIIEDARWTYNDVKKEFGVEAAEIAYALTNEKGKTRAERANAKYYEGIMSVKHAPFAKMADRIANSIYSYENNISMTLMYKKEYSKFRGYLYTESIAPMFEFLENFYKGVK